VPWWQALLFAFFGGALLNLMPCVLPILALKVAGFATIAHEERGALVLHGVGYAAGVIGSMVALASAVLGLRSVGTAVGWGFQFQQPWFLVALTLLFTAFATNLFGVWQLTVRTDRMGALHDRSHGAWRSVLEGVLAVLVATPCTAPLLGVAVGVALAAPAPLLVAVFVTLGAGLAAEDSAHLPGAQAVGSFMIIGRRDTRWRPGRDRDLRSRRPDPAPRRAIADRRCGARLDRATCLE
jgi:thiol:disulfide interchange protein DsbD